MRRIDGPFAVAALADPTVAGAGAAFSANAAGAVAARGV